MQYRQAQLDQLHDAEVDVLVVGAGINGAVTAAALSSCGVQVALVDGGDFAGQTSQASSNLVWGGIKYLEGGELRLVRELCHSRNRLLQAFPSHVQEIRFLATISKGFRWPPWFLYAGTWLYWMLGGGQTQRPQLFSAKALKAREPILNTIHCAGGLEYSDAYLPDNDARLVFRFVRQALDQGARVANYLLAKACMFDGDRWHSQLCDQASGRCLSLRSRVLINACGPFADAFNQQLQQPTRHCHQFSKGIHLIVPQLSAVRRVLTFFADDGRLFFAIPMGQRTCIGTTDTQVASPACRVSAADRQFVLRNINARLRLPHPLTEHDIIAERCGVRPLVVKRNASGQGNWLQLSRRHQVEFDRARQQMTLFGGKLTDCLNIGEEVCQQLMRAGLIQRALPPNWFGEPAPLERQVFEQIAQSLPSVWRQRFWHRYGGHAAKLLARVQADADGLRCPVPEFKYCRAELGWLAEQEQILYLDDFLRRRTSLAMQYSAAQILQMPGLGALATLLFGEQAESKLRHYREQQHVSQ